MAPESNNKQLRDPTRIRLSDYTSISFEIVVAALTILPFFLLGVTREMKKRFGAVKTPVRLNFANPLLWVLIACGVAYFLLVFLPE